MPTKVCSSRANLTVNGRPDNSGISVYLTERDAVGNIDRWSRLALGACLLVVSPSMLHASEAGAPKPISSAQWGLTPRDFSALESAELLEAANPRRHADWAAAAKAGDDNAMLLLALAIRYRVVSDTSGQLANNWMMRAAAAGNARARFEVADQSYWGLKLLSQDDLALVRHWLTEAADAGNALASMKLGIWQIEGLHGVVRNEAAGVDRLNIAAEAGAIPAMLYLGTLQPSDGASRDYRFFSDGDTASVHRLDPTIPPLPELKLPSATIAHWLRRAAEAGSTRAQFGMALAHANGWGVPQDKTREVYWHRRAAEAQGSTRSFGVFEWSHRLIKGDGVPTDRAAGLALAREFHTAWPQEVPNFLRSELTQDEWANWLLHDRGTNIHPNQYVGLAEKSHAQPQRLIAILRVLADNGDAQWMRQLGFIFAEGSFRGKAVAMQPDLTQSLYWFERAAQHGNGSSMILAARQYYDGKGTARNPAKAYAWLAQAEKSRDPRTRENAAAEIVRFQQRDAVRAEKIRIAKARADAEERAWREQMAREQARIDQLNAEAAAAYQAQADRRHALNRTAWRFYRPQFTGFPTLDAVEADRAWKAAQADVQFFEYCRTNNCYAQSAQSRANESVPEPRGSAIAGGSSNSNVGRERGTGTAVAIVGAEQPSKSHSSGGAIASADPSSPPNRNAMGSSQSVASAGTADSNGTQTALTLTIESAFVPEPPPILPEIPEFTPTPRPPRPVSPQAPCPGPTSCATPEAAELTPAELIFKSQMDAWYAANEAASAADAAQRKRIEEIRAERRRISDEHGKRQHARRLACDGGDASQCQP